MALHGAADGGHDGVVRLLLPRTSEPRSKNAQGLTPADVARDRGYGDLAKLLDGAPRGSPAAAPAAAPAQGFGTMDIDDPNHPRFHKQ